MIANTEMGRGGRSGFPFFNATEKLYDYIESPRRYCCSTCRCHAADHDEIISKAFQGRHGRAFLLSNVVNVSLGKREDRLLITGLHSVADIHCNSCNTVLGWKYEQAYERTQKYKEGKFIVEKAKIIKDGHF